jgi:hypothetical protein
MPGDRTACVYLADRQRRLAAEAAVKAGRVATSVEIG